MKILLLHPDDVADHGTWSREQWDLVIDLGFAGPELYGEWNRLLKCKILSIHQFALYPESHRWVNQVFEQGRGQLVDQIGLDWWEILAVVRYQDLHALFLLRQLQQEISGSVELAASRPHRFTKIAERVFGVAVRYFARDDDKGLRRTMRALRSARRLRFRQITDIAFDKWDPDYQLRRRFAGRDRVTASQPCVLLPSAYSNVTRSVLAYASRLPHRRFLLVTTRQNAIPGSAPANVRIKPLAAYVHRKKSSDEEQWLQESWRKLSARLQSNDEQFRCAASAGVWDCIPAQLAHGLILRSVWSSVLRSEQVTGVLCGDDLNYHTRLPLLLAQRGGLNAIYCSHGALDNGFFFKKELADAFLVKGEMERDYLQRAARVDPERVFVGAPVARTVGANNAKTGKAVVFFSQPYEVTGGRADAIYREIVPRLYSMAVSVGKKLVIKLHPFESRRARQELVFSALSGIGSDQVEIVDGVPPNAVISRAWCGLTVDSSVAVECAMRNVPFFLCGWLDFTGDGYLGQFARFGVARVLGSPDEIGQIPQIVSEFRADPAGLQLLSREIDPNVLDELLFGSKRAGLKPCALNQSRGG